MPYTLLGLMFKVFFVAALAYVLARRGIFTREDQRSVTNVLMKLVVFFTVLMSSQQPFSLEAAKAIAFTAVYAVAFFGLGIPTMIWLSGRLKLEDDKRRILVMSVTFNNITFVGYPILQELYGNTGLLCVITFSMVYNVLFYTWGMAYLGKRGRVNLRSLLTNRIALCSVAALVLYFVQFRFPEPFYSTFDSVSTMTMPMSMIIIGCSLAQSGIWSVLRDKSLYLPTFLRMGAVPAVVYLVLRLCRVDPMILRISTIIAALPSGSMTSIVATEYNCQPEYAAKVMVQTMLAMLAALPFWVFVVGL